MHSSFDITTLFPTDFYRFVVVTVFSLLLGLEQRIKHSSSNTSTIFGTDRTFTFIGILGFVLYIIQPQTLLPFMLGALILGGLLITFYLKKINTENNYGITTIVLAFITYCLAPLVYTQPHWLVILLVVVLLVLEELKKPLYDFSQKMNNEEFITLAKFLVMSGVILPLLPNQSISPIINFSPYKFWLAIVAISGISYGSYLLKKYIFPQSGVILTGILGGMYSSTATTFILAKKSKDIDEPRKISAAIILATSMMFIRIFVLALIFNKSIAYHIAPAFGILFCISLITAVVMLWQDKKLQNSPKNPVHIENALGNPLELKTAFVFGVLFVFFSVLTHYVTEAFSTQGIKILSYLVGVTDIDPFIINILQSKYNVTEGALAIAIINAVTSNNLLKMMYAISLSAKSIHRYIIMGFSALIVLGIILAFL
ncbi:MgtC/SapB family protein [Tenacibaculum sp. TC6]|uniref:MgtC/SapB family protein n=1 Tax=Tenacibaculum sp. TC6 TaxID=3423223 RepID=UPI003D3610AE